MMRPLAPFTVRPVKHARIRKLISTATINDVAAELPTAVKAGRRPIKSSVSKLTPALRVINRAG